MEGKATIYRDIYSVRKNAFGSGRHRGNSKAKNRKKGTKEKIALRGRVFSVDFLSRDHSICSENSHLDPPSHRGTSRAKIRKKKRKKPIERSIREKAKNEKSLRTQAPQNEVKNKKTGAP